MFEYPCLRMFQLIRGIGKISSFQGISRSFSIIPCSKISTCKCINCMKRIGSHGRSCGCNRCYSGDAKSPDSLNNSDNTKEIQERDTKIAQLQDSYLRCLADMENLRQRTKKEVDSASSFAIQKFCKDIISVADVLELAVGIVKNDPRTSKLLKGQEEAIEESDTPSDAVNAALEMSKEELAHRLKDLSVGLSMTLSELIKVFARHGVTSIEPLHQKFDPNFHMALYEVNNPDLEIGTVVAVQKKGYLLNHRVVRPASVGVSKKDDNWIKLNWIE